MKCKILFLLVVLKNVYTLSMHEQLLNDDIPVLHAACAEGDIEMVRSLLGRSSVNINEQDKQRGATAVHYAVRGGRDFKYQMEILQLLKNAGADLNVYDNEGLTPLLVGVWHGVSSGVIWSLLHLGADVNKEDRRFQRDIFGYETTRCAGATPLHYLMAAHTNIDWQIELLSLFNLFKADINKKDKAGLSPLHYAVQENADERVINCLLYLSTQKSKRNTTGQALTTRNFMIEHPPLVTAVYRWITALCQGVINLRCC